MTNIRLGTLAICLVVSSGAAHGAGKADKRAVDYCKKQSENFAKIADCLPGADMAYATFDAFDKLYADAAWPLRDVCLRKNENRMPSAASCIRVAIEKAVQLRESVGEDVTIDDPVYKAVSDAKSLAILEKAVEKARAKYPMGMIGGLTTYQPYD